jgi:hypothetical protein
MKKINPILVASILLLSASAKANMPVGGYNSEPDTKSGASVAWLGVDFSESLGKLSKNYTRKKTDGRRKKNKKLDPKTEKRAEKRRTRRLDSFGKRNSLAMDKELRARAEREYDHRHAPHKYR